MVDKQPAFQEFADIQKEVLTKTLFYQVVAFRYACKNLFNEFLKTLKVK